MQHPGHRFDRAVDLWAEGVALGQLDLHLARQGFVDEDEVDRTGCTSTLRCAQSLADRGQGCLIVHEATRTSGFGSELSALVTERCFYHLEAPVERVTGFDTPYPHSLEWAYFPGPVRIGEAIDKILKD